MKKEEEVLVELKPRIELRKAINYKKHLSDRPITIVMYYADWCTPCQMTKPALERIHNEMPGVQVLFSNIDKDPDGARQLGVGVVPTLIYYRTGKLVDVTTGYQSRDMVETRIKTWF